MRSVDVGILICAGILTGACGVKGPLYLPNVPRDAPWPYVKPEKSSSPARAPQSGSPPAAPSGSPEPANSGTPSPPAAAPDPRP
ncbi:MAG: hypothetical protein E6H52_13920 [Betaproteobacteria bacterium]|nr:MAG: hypothetical protein E6H52_13920 [Betaproteobacteria bacterium]